jgi:hypothetical protein
MILTGLPGFSTAAGYVGTYSRFDHDISLLVPEIWCRLSAEDRNPDYLIKNGLLEPLKDLELADGTVVPARRLGYRITRRFVRRYFGRVFDNPATVFDDRILRPETQDPEAFVDGVQYIMEAYERVARRYFDDGTIEEACPPLKALLHIMAHGHYEGKDERDPDIRAMFTREALLKSDWYRERLQVKQQRDIHLWKRHLTSVSNYLETQKGVAPEFIELLQARQAYARTSLETVSTPDYLNTLTGSLGADPLGTAPELVS